MDKKYYSNLTVSSAPHLVTALDTQKTMLMVILALVPALAMGVYVFGIRALLLTIVCVASSVFFEWGYEKLLKRPDTIKDLSAALTGMLIAFNIPANFPFWMAILGCFVAIILVKQLYGGLGRNFANPAIVGRIFLLLSFTARMTSWPAPLQYDGTTGATPLGMLKETELSALKDLELPSNLNMFLGTIGGTIGEISALALLIGGIFLVYKKIISPLTPIAFIGTVFVIAFIYYSALGGEVNALKFAIFHVCAGGVMLGSIFMATDYVTSPIMPLGKIIMGIGCGFFTMIIRLWAGYPEGVSFAILFMNVLVPLIDMLCIKLTYGGAKKNEK